MTNKPTSQEDYEKVFFESTSKTSNCEGESMWVKVNKRGEETIGGILDNTPIFTAEHGYNYGDKVVATKYSKSPNTRFQALTKPHAQTTMGKYNLNQFEMKEKKRTYSPLFEAVWTAIKGWDIERKEGEGYAHATGDDVREILKATDPFLARQ